MLVARRPISIGSEVFGTGDRITRSAQDQLPSGRMPQLIAHGWVEELVDEVALERRVENLEQMVDDLRALVAKLALAAPATKRRRRTKAQDEDEESEAPAEAAPEEIPAPEEDEAPTEAEPEPEPPAEAEPTPDEMPDEGPEEVPAPEVPAEETSAKIWDPIDACWKSEDELVAATEARTRRRRTKVG